MKASIYGSREAMTARFKGTCRTCGLTIYRGDTIYFFPKTRKVEHYNCARQRGTVGR